MNHKLLGSLSIVGVAALAAACGLSGQGTAPGAEGPGGKDATSAGDSGGSDQDASLGMTDAAPEAGTDGETPDDATGTDATSPDGTGGDATNDLDGANDAAGEGGDAPFDGPAVDGSPVDGGRDADATVPADAGGPDGGPVDAAADHADASRLDGGAEGGDAGSAACNFNGTWASRLTIDVSWQPQGLNSIILAPGTGQIRQWIKGVRVQTGMSTADATVVCGIELPDFQETAIAGGETYGVKFPDSLFDTLDGGYGYLPTFTVNAALSGLTPGSTYSTTTTAVLLGLTMTSPTTTPWPATISTQADMDQDTKPGITTAVAQGSTYSDVPTQIPPLFGQPARANKLYVAIRQVTIVTGTVQDCDHMAGTVAIPQINSKSAIDSHVMGCALSAGGDCTTTQASFVDNTQPVFTPSGATDFHSVRLATGATCADVRAALP